MLQDSIRFTVSSVCLALTLILSVKAPPHPLYAASAQGAAPPAECLSDRGYAVEPNPAVADAWVLVLNFNHAPAADFTTGCIVSRTGPDTLDYTLVECWLDNNIRQVAVGGGAAPFDGNFWINCPAIGQGDGLQSNFDVTGSAHFSGPGDYTLMSHLDAGISAFVDIDWHVGLASRYGKTSFASRDSQPSAPGPIIHLLSFVSEKVGTHMINGNPLTPTAAVDPFNFDSGQSITVGAPGEVWTLLEVIIDPAGSCCR